MLALKKTHCWIQPLDTHTPHHTYHHIEQFLFSFVVIIVFFIPTAMPFVSIYLCTSNENIFFSSSTLDYIHFSDLVSKHSMFSISIYAFYLQSVFVRLSSRKFIFIQNLDSLMLLEFCWRCWWWFVFLSGSISSYFCFWVCLFSHSLLRCWCCSFGRKFTCSCRKPKTNVDIWRLFPKTSWKAH